MDTGVLIPIIVLVILVALLALYLWSSYRSLVALRQRVDEAWRDLTAQFAHRAELLPELVEAVRGYGSHERVVLDSALEARTATQQASTPAEATLAENRLQQSLKSVFSAADAYPALTAGPRFLQLQSELGDAQNGIQASRRFYNGGVREFNAKIQTFPGSMFARREGFTRREFFEVPDGPSKAEPPRIQF